MANQSLKQYGTRVPTPQSQPIAGRDMVQNSASGYVFAVDDWSRLHRFLILGSDGGSYYASERKLTFENLDVVQAAIQADGPRVVSILTEISDAGRAPKNDQALFVLAMCAAADDQATRQAAYAALPKVARIGTHLFQFLTYMQQFRGWSRGLRTAVSNWYLERDVDSLAYQLVKYRQRDGWTHRDVLRKAHAKAETPEMQRLLRWAAGKGEWTGNASPKLDGGVMPRTIHGYMAAQHAESPETTAALVKAFNLPREALLTEHLNSNEVWEAMLENGMPITALVRNLATMTRNGLLTGTSDATKTVLKTLGDAEAVSKSRIHPLAALVAMKVYARGYSQRGDSQWGPIPRIVDALDDLFYAAFGNVEGTGLRRLIALDVSGSMNHPCSGTDILTAREASAAMAMVSMKTGDPYEVIAFSNGRTTNYHDQNSVTVLPFSPRQRLDDIVAATDRMPFSGTNCALPMIYAHQEAKPFDVFEIYTDNETWFGSIHPVQALDRYRSDSGINAKCVVVGMTSSGFSIADPNDPGMLDCVGFDTSTPQIIAAFAEGGF